ncbi:MAG: glycoside hydrolase family 16 protein [Flavobacteriales bacterium]|nr:glycoside hydrolase family 16 protein [Flavobacteriales bacterium]
MMRLRSLFAVMILTQLLTAQPLEMLQLREDGIAQWSYVDGDEFNESSINEKAWRKSYPWGRSLGSNMLQYYADDNTFLEEGLLKMEARKQDTLAKGIPYWDADKILNDGTKNEKVYNYTSGMLFSEKKYYQGYFEARLKTSKGKGYFPAFWLYGANPNEEIDIIEAKGERPFSYHVDMHCPDGCSDYRKFLWWRTSSYGDWIDLDEDLTSEFHNYAGEWVPGEIVFYFDDQAKDQWAGNLEHPANVIFNLGISGREGGGSFDGGIDETTPFPQTFEVDYVRIYDRIDEGWKEKEEARLNKKGRKKKKNKKRVSKRVSATARIFQEDGNLRIETTGLAKFSFRLVNEEGVLLKELDQNTEGSIECNLSEISDGVVWLRSRANGFEATTKLGK